MESQDGAGSTDGASGETSENLCDPCNYDGIKAVGRYFCLECGEYFCVACKDSHARFKSFRGHKFISKQAVSRMSADSKVVQFTVTCSCEHNLEAIIYCESHNEAICETCKTVKHRKCMTASVKDKSTAYVISKLTSVIQNAQNMRDEFHKFQQRRAIDVKTVADLAKKCKEDIHSFREQLIAFVDVLEQTILLDLDNIVEEEKQNIEFQISSCSAPLKILNEDLKLLDLANNADEKDRKFASDVKVSNHLKDFQSLLQDLNRVKNPSFKFEQNQKLIDIEKEIKNLGKIIVGRMSHKADMISFLGMKVDSSSLVEIKLPDEKYIPWISGCVFMPDGHLIGCDRRNNRVKLLSSSFQFEEKLDLENAPRDVSLVDSSSVIVTLPEIKTLQYIKALPCLQTGRSIVLDRKCWGVCVESSIIYITCHDDSGGAEARMLDMSGTLLKKVPLADKYGSPYYVAISATTKLIYLSSISAVTCFTPDWNISFRHEGAELNEPKGLCLDDEDNIFVCGSRSHDIHMYMSKLNGTKHSILADAEAHKVQKPYSVTFRHSDNTLVVGCDGINLVVLKLTF